MARATFNSLVFPYRRAAHGVREYAVFRRADSVSEFWQGISGGGEGDETPLQAAIRECGEEAGFPAHARFIELSSRATVPAIGFSYRAQWGPDVLVIDEFSFGVDGSHHDITLSAEHTEFRWLAFDAAMKIVRYDSNRNALWELDERLHRMAGGTPWRLG